MSTSTPCFRRMLAKAALLVLLGLPAAITSPHASAQRYVNLTFQGQVKVDSTYPILWFSQGFSTTMRIEYTTGADQWKLVDTAVLAPGSGQYLWKIPDDTTSTAQLRLVIDDTVRARSIQFAIRHRLVKMLQLYRPLGGQVLYGGTPLTVMWGLSYAEGFNGSVIADYSIDSGRTWRTLDSVPHTTWVDSLIVTLPPDTTSTGRFRVRTSDGEAVATTSSDLIIRPQPAVRILRPNGGETFRIDSLVYVVWDAVSLNGHFTIEYSADGEFWQTIESRRSVKTGLDSVAWLVPAPPTERGRLRVVHEEGDLTDETDILFRVIDGTSSAPDEGTLPTQMNLSHAAPKRSNTPRPANAAEVPRH